MNARHLILLTAGLLLPALATAQVLPQKVREERLQQAIDGLSVPDAHLQERLPGLRDPFYASMPEAKRPTPGTQQQAVAAPAARSDADVLQLVARSFQPTGSIILGDKRLLVLPSGGNIALGSSFTARLDGQSYTVQITTISSTGYTLRLNNVTLPCTFSGTGRAAP